ncbi:hypothetical protein [Streptomyces sp. NPDC056165]|uniref:hypothetical protein n=1 Tax=Streptomyces sp. NPDC056165 TaxID=3345733 RepID=UPI0035D53644
MGLGQPWQASHVLLLIPVVLIVVITAADIATGPNIVLSPLLVVAPTLTAWFAGPWMTAGIGVLAMAGEAVSGWRTGTLSCNAAGISKGRSSEQVAIFTDCVTAAGLDGIDNTKVRTWIQTELPAMLGKDGMQVEHIELGKAMLSMDTAGNIAAISIEQQ